MSHRGDQPSHGAGPHLAPDEVARFVDKREWTAERDRVLSHLADCAACRAEVLAVRRITARRTWRKGLSIGVPVAAAAAVVLLMLPGAQQGSSGIPPVDGTALRTDTATSQLTAIAPLDGASVEGDSLELQWSDAGGTGPYALTISDLAGTTVHRATVDRAGVAISIAELEKGATYLWYVDGIVNDGTPATTGVRSFTVRP